MLFLQNLARKYENPGHILLSRQNNLGVYKTSEGYEVWDVVQNCRWTSNDTIEGIYEDLEAIYYGNPLLLLCEPDGSLWHDTGIITNVSKFMVSALTKFPTVEIMAVPDELA